MGELDVFTFYLDVTYAARVGGKRRTNSSIMRLVLCCRLFQACSRCKEGPGFACHAPLEPPYPGRERAFNRCDG